MGTQYFAGNAHASDLVRRNGGVGSGFRQSLSKFLVNAAGYDAQVGVFLPG